MSLKKDKYIVDISFDTVMTKMGQIKFDII